MECVRLAAALNLSHAVSAPCHAKPKAAASRTHSTASPNFPFLEEGVDCDARARRGRRPQPCPPSSPFTSTPTPSSLAACHPFLKEGEVGSAAYGARQAWLFRGRGRPRPPDVPRSSIAIRQSLISNHHSAASNSRIWRSRASMDSHRRNCTRARLRFCSG